ncbi:MAG: sodium:proton antiporter NhaD [Candidatus Omnitrophica bacterium]|nr:sodium:proton antiporter NhaD [Candidatus Omnitrophota bacterium]MCB9748337.1 sodium:proton antiporter NhaD [Candidatus Omnitrophota bacterium]
MSISILVAIFFCLGYIAIILEHQTSVNKAAAALLTGVFCWISISFHHFPNINEAMIHLNHHLTAVSQIIIFLLGAMTIVELINVYDGFRFITGYITTKNKRILLWMISFTTFFLSALLDNMTTSIVMVILLRRFIENSKERFIFASMIIIAANAGGAWSPIGDVTTTMLWIDNRITSFKLIEKLFLPSLVSILIPLTIFTFSIKEGERLTSVKLNNTRPLFGAKRVLFLGVTALIFVPILHAITGLPPYMGMILGLGVMWTLTDLIHQERHYLKVPHVLTRIDISSVLFFLGVLLAVAALETIGILDSFAVFMNTYFKSKDTILIIMGILSSIIDNVPLMAGTMGMYSVHNFPVDSKIWEMAAYCLGSGGSILIIGSAAGVIVMGMEKIKFSTYLKKITLPTLIGYIAGVIVLLLI